MLMPRGLTYSSYKVGEYWCSMMKGVVGMSICCLCLGEFLLRLRHLEQSLLQALNEVKGRILDDDR